MAKICRGGYVFVTRVGDHLPRHVHLCRDGRLVVRSALVRGQALEGAAPARVRKLLAELVEEGLL